MKLIGPLALPPPESVSLADRSVERLVPLPEPHLKSIPSVLARFRMDSSESWTELMKQAEHCGLRYPVSSRTTFCSASSQCQFLMWASGSQRSTPQLNQTGELKLAFWVSIRCANSARKLS